MKDHVLTPDLEKEILEIRTKIQRAEFNVKKLRDEKRVREAYWQFVPVEPVKEKPDYFYVWTLAMGFILGLVVSVIARNW